MRRPRAPFDYEQWLHDHPRPAAKRLANLNVGEPRMVRMIYFLILTRKLTLLR